MRSKLETLQAARKEKEQLLLSSRDGNREETVQRIDQTADIVAQESIRDECVSCADIRKISHDHNPSALNEAYSQT